MSDKDYARAMEWTLMIFGQRMAVACEKADWDEVERCLDIIVCRRDAFCRRTSAPA